MGDILSRTAWAIYLSGGIYLHVWPVEESVGADRVQVQLLPRPGSVSEIKVLAQSGPFIIAEESRPRDDAARVTRKFLLGRGLKWKEISESLERLSVDGSLISMVSDGTVAHMFWTDKGKRSNAVRHLVAGPDDEILELPFSSSMPDVGFRLVGTASSGKNIAAIVSPHPLVYAQKRMSHELRRGAVFVRQEDGWNMVKVSSWEDHAPVVGMYRDYLWVACEMARTDAPGGIRAWTYLKNRHERYAFSETQDFSGVSACNLRQLTVEGRYMIRVLHCGGRSEFRVDNLESNATASVKLDKKGHLFSAYQTDSVSLLLLASPEMHFPKLVNPFVVTATGKSDVLEVVSCKPIVAPDGLVFERIYAVLERDILYYLPKYSSVEGF